MENDTRGKPAPGVIAAVTVRREILPELKSAKVSPIEESSILPGDDRSIVQQ